MRREIENNVAKAFDQAGVKSVLVAVSGGADSVALLCACAHVAPRLGLRLEAANCNFHLRGAESDRDSEFTDALCKRLGIKLHRLNYNVGIYVKEHPGISTEMACRELRYADFFRICQNEAIDRVAVAHNADDDIETMLLNMLRGSGTRGMRGMEPDNGTVIRPLLGISRKDIEEYLAVIGQNFITDSSNLTSEYRRNFLRHEIIPLLESRWPGAIKSLSRTLSIIKEESSITEAYYQTELSRRCPQPRTLMLKDGDDISTGVVIRFLEPFGGNPSIADEIIECIGKQHGERRWKLSKRHEAILERDRLVIIDHKDMATDPTIEWEKLKLTPEVMTEILKNRSHDIIYLPQDSSAYEIRRPQTGDRMAPLGMKGTRLVSDIISDARLDRLKKEQVRVLVSRKDGEIVWVTGLKRSRHELIKPGDGIFCYRGVYKYGECGI